MALANVAFFSQSIKTYYGQTTAANTTITGSPDDIAVLFTLTVSGSSGKGARVLHVSGTPTETTGGAGVAYLYLSKDSGTTYRLIDAVAVASDTVSTSDAPTRFEFAICSKSDPLELEAGDRIAVGFSLAKIIDWAAQVQFYDA